MSLCPLYRSRYEAELAALGSARVFAPSPQPGVIRTEFGKPQSSQVEALVSTAPGTTPGSTANASGSLSGTEAAHGVCEEDKLWVDDQPPLLAPLDSVGGPTALDALTSFKLASDQFATEEGGAASTTGGKLIAELQEFASFAQRLPRR